MLVERVMTRHVTVVNPGTTVGEAEEVMRLGRFRHLPVLDDGRVVGIVSDRDVRLAVAQAVGARLLVDAWFARAASDGAPAPPVPPPTVGAVMRQTVVTVTPSTPIEQASRLMADHKIGALPVVERGRLVGILTATDLFRALADLLAASGEPADVRQPTFDGRGGETARGPGAKEASWPARHPDAGPRGRRSTSGGRRQRV